MPSDPIVVRYTSTTRAQVEGFYEFSKLSDRLAYRPPGYKFMAAYRRRTWDGYIRLLTANGTFPAGLANVVADFLREQGHPVEAVNMIERPRLPITHTNDIKLEGLTLYPWQKKAVRVAVQAGRGVVKVATGGGKCLGLGERVLMLDGTTRKVEDVRPGDLLMGPDSKPREVLSTTRGRGPLYRITPTRGRAWVCNDVHVLTLQHTVTGEVIDIPLDEYLRERKTFRHVYKQFSTGVEWPERRLPVDPYFFGVWLGDGRKDLSQGVQVSKPDEEIRALCEETAKAWELELRVDVYGACPTYRLVSTSWRSNRLLLAMRELWPSLPREYLTGSREQRAAFLAGLLDTDGHLHNGGYDFIQKDKRIAKAACFVAQSLGLRALMRRKRQKEGTYWRVSISGDCSMLPLRIARKKAPPRAQKKSATRTGFKVRPLGEGDYAGFTLDGDGRFLLADFTVTHNTELVAGIIRSLEGARPPKTLVVVPNRSLLMQTKKRLESRLGYEVGSIGFGKWNENYVTVAIPDTLGAAKFNNERHALMQNCEVLVLDECHHSPSQKWSEVIGKCKAWYRFGFSGTPLDRGDGSDLKLQGQTGSVIVDISSSLLVAQGKLAKPTVEMVDVKKPQLPKGLEYADVYALGIVRNEHFHKLLVQRVKDFWTEGKHVLVLVTRIDHGDTLSAMLADNGNPVPHLFVHGKTLPEDLTFAMTEFQAGRIPVLIASPIFGEGTDLPNIDVLVIADGGKSVIKTVQKAGRAMRPKKGKPNECRVVDFTHYTHPKLLEHSIARVSTYRREEFDVINPPVEGDPVDTTTASR